MSARNKTKPKKESKSFTTRVSLETWEKVEEYKKYGNWNTNPLLF